MFGLRAPHQQSRFGRLVQISAKIRDLTARRLYLSEKKDALLNAKATRLNPERDWAAQFDWEAEAHQLLRDPFGLAHFRPLQREAINCTLAKKDAVCILPSGGAVQPLPFMQCSAADHSAWHVSSSSFITRFNT
jgi:hypothetical protein